MSDRKITHMVPDDGTTHTCVECYCHPDITEANNSRSLMGMDEVGVTADEAGALLFMHHQASAASRWSECIELDDEPTEETP